MKGREREREREREGERERGRELVTLRLHPTYSAPLIPGEGDRRGGMSVCNWRKKTGGREGEGGIAGIYFKLYGAEAVRERREREERERERAVYSPPLIMCASSAPLP